MRGKRERPGNTLTDDTPHTIATTLGDPSTDDDTLDLASHGTVSLWDQ